jgi:hypothetical protein
LAEIILGRVIVNTPIFSVQFDRLYCDPALFDPFSSFHPISFRRALPFQYPEEGVDDPDLLRAEETHLVEPSDDTRRAVVTEYLKCGLIEETEAANLLPIVDFFGADFFELMGLFYANAGRFRCALRWYRELITRFETQDPNTCHDPESVYASVGYCLYSLCLFEEAISWSKSCVGPEHLADTMCRALIRSEIAPIGGSIRAVERAAGRIRYTLSGSEPVDPEQTNLRLKAAIQTVAPEQQVYIDWISPESPGLEIPPDSYPFRVERDASNTVRHKMNLIFATCNQADALLKRGYRLEAKRLLSEAAIIEPEAQIVLERLRALA